MRLILIVALAAGVVGAIVLPRILWRGQFLSDQRRLLDYTPAQDAVALTADAFGIRAEERLPALRRYDRHVHPDARDTTRDGAAFIGRRTAGGVEYLVVVRLPAQGWQEGLVMFVPTSYTVAGWGDNPLLTPGQRWHEIQVPDGTLRVIRGTGDPDDPAVFRFHIDQDHPDGTTTRQTAVGLLEPDGRVRLEIPDPLEPRRADESPQGGG